MLTRKRYVKENFVNADAYSEPCQTSKVERFADIVYG